MIHVIFFTLLHTPCQFFCLTSYFISHAGLVQLIWIRLAFEKISSGSLNLTTERREVEILYVLYTCIQYTAYLGHIIVSVDFFSVSFFNYLYHIKIKENTKTSRKLSKITNSSNFGSKSKFGLEFWEVNVHKIQKDYVNIDSLIVKYKLKLYIYT